MTRDGLWRTKTLPINLLLISKGNITLKHPNRSNIVYTKCTQGISFKVRHQKPIENGHQSDVPPPAQLTNAMTS
jgi:hypothetical protein